MIPRTGIAASLPLLCLLLSCSAPPRLPTAPAPSGDQRPAAPPYRTLSFTGPFPAWVETTLAALSLEEKAGQMIMAKTNGHYQSASSDEYQRLVRLVTEVKVGGLAVFQGDVYSSAVLLNRLQRRASVPLLVAADYERGLPMRTRRGTPFPEAMALGATRNPDLAYQAGRATALEARALGVHQNFAPVVDVNNNPVNPVINTRSFGEDPRLVGAMGAAYLRGLNDGGVVSTAKHFPGHGDTGVDSHLELPVLPFDRRRLDSIELAPFREAIAGGAMAVMVGHLEVPALDATPGMPASLSRRAVTGVLREELGFRGLVVTDAMDMRGLVRGFPPADAAVRAVRAGADVLLMPTDERSALRGIVGAVLRGELSEARIDSSVRRILMAKQWLLLDEQREVDLDRIAETVGARDHQMLARRIARAAVTVVRNDSALLPLPQHGRARIAAVIVSDTDDNRTEIHRTASPWPNEPVGAYFLQQFRRRHQDVRSARLTPSSNAAQIESVLAGAARADIVLVPLYVKVRTSTGAVGIPEAVLPFVERLALLRKPVVIAAFGNPYLVGAFPFARAALCAYSDAEPMVEAAVEAIFGEIDVTGRLPVSVPGLYPLGSGLQMIRTELRTDDPAAAGFDRERLGAVDSIVAAAIRDSAFPGAQVLVAKDGVIALHRAYGALTYDRTAPAVDLTTLYDLASLTKVAATTAAVMNLCDRRLLRPDDPAARWLPAFAVPEKQAITIRHLLMHTAGFPPFRSLRELGRTPSERLDAALATPLVARPGDSTIYSDLGMIALGRIVELAAGMPLEAFVMREFYEPLTMRNTMFRPPSELRVRAAPTELDTLRRGGLVQGEVHDENAAALGGAAGHAGLFSNAQDLAIFMQMIINGGTYGGRRYLADSTVTLFTRRAAPGTRALGWDVPSARGSTAGTLFSRTSFGHTGFTGTSVWADPERRLLVIFLTNRVHPTRANNRIAAVRPALHDAVVRALLPGAGGIGLLR